MFKEENITNNFNNRNLCQSAEIRENLRYGEGEAKYTYGGKELDDETNLYYFRCPWMDKRRARQDAESPMYIYCNNNPLSFVDPTGLEDYEVTPSSIQVYKDNELINNNQNNNLTTITTTTTTTINNVPPSTIVAVNPDGYHCDVNTWNQAISQGYDPRPSSGENLDLNRMTVNEVYQNYNNSSTSTHEEGTAGLAFYNPPGGDDNYTHMFFYDNTDPSSDGTYQAWDSNGINPQTENTWNENGTAVQNSRFVPLNQIENNGDQ